MLSACFESLSLFLVFWSTEFALGCKILTLLQFTWPQIIPRRTFSMKETLPTCSWPIPRIAHHLSSSSVSSRVYQVISCSNPVPWWQETVSPVPPPTLGSQGPHAGWHGSFTVAQVTPAPALGHPFSSSWHGSVGKRQHSGSASLPTSKATEHGMFQSNHSGIGWGCPTHLLPYLRPLAVTLSWAFRNCEHPGGRITTINVAAKYCKTSNSPSVFCLPRGKIVFTDIPWSGRQF